MVQDAEWQDLSPFDNSPQLYLGPARGWAGRQTTLVTSISSPSMSMIFTATVLSGGGAGSS